MVFKSIGRGIKKVFRGVKKVVKKIAKPALIATAIFFTAGLAAGGFAAFGATTGLSFLGAVGQTTVAGVQAIAGSLGIGSGIAGTGMTSAFAGTATKGAKLSTGILAQGLGLSAGPAGLQALQATPAGAGVLKAGSAPAFPGATEVSRSSLSALGGSAASGYSAGAANSALKVTSKGIFGKLGSAFAGLGDLGQLAVIQGVMGGIGSVMQGKEMRRQEKRADEVGMFGVPMKGDPAYSSEQIAEIFSQYRFNPVGGSYTPPPVPDVDIGPTPRRPRRDQEEPTKTSGRGLLAREEEYQSQRFESSRAIRSNLPRDEMGIPRPLLG